MLNRVDPQTCHITIVLTLLCIPYTSISGDHLLKVEECVLVEDTRDCANLRYTSSDGHEKDQIPEMESTSGA